MTVICAVSPLISLLILNTKLKCPGEEARVEDLLSIDNKLIKKCFPKMVIRITEASIQIMLNGHLDACIKLSGVTFDPMVNPIITKLKFLIGSGTKNLNPNTAAIEQTVVGPVKNGAGAPMYQANKAPSGPNQNECMILPKDNFSNRLCFNE
jgi:hypothetical protein